MSSLHILTSVQDAVQWLRNRVTGQLRTDSRQVQPGDAFIAWPGGVSDGRAYVASALERGAVACLVEAEGAETFDLPADTVAAFHGLKAVTGQIADLWLAHPSQALAVVAVTGTNGKTSTAWWLAHALADWKQGVQSGCALVGTLGIGVPPALESTGMTTPDPVCLQQAFRGYVDQGLAACAIEASSIGIEEHRLDGTRLRCAIFTNFTQDHLDYHGSMDAYWEAKRRLFDWDGLQTAVVNIDDAHGRLLAQQLHSRSDLDLWTLSIQQPARLWAKDIGHGTEGLRFTVVEGDAFVSLQTQVVGHYNISNLLGVIATLRSLGMPLDQAVQACAHLEPVPGRMQQIARAGQPLVAVDYAHTPDALEQALQALQPVARERGGQLWCVFGCGGNRDATKRPLMGQAAQRHADLVLVTSDNPRGEAPQAIVDQIVAGMQPADLQVEVDRAAAIAQAIAQAAPQDVVLLAGKGHEDYQEVMGVKRPFSDMAEAHSALSAREGQAK
ncbi:UDP-N-acetylmuramoyl-L-alanyl-D-glutamate--2,6-diaminopimelate ligase [Comamonas sp. GB3 AK4-5]|uniref:UDP-N-acetylmuramoyl-L-alanyl-D-glutamate--2, 6-diaminopimelate ligase n=1 Tax=Comamonas sp. GB3 AK4-5 TaxID=3231487 RepID=UPI00351DF4A0